MPFSERQTPSAPETSSQNDLADSLMAMQAGLKSEERKKRETEIASARAALEVTDPDPTLYLEGDAGRKIYAELRRGIDAHDVKAGQLERVEPIQWKKRTPTLGERFAGVAKSVKGFFTGKK